MIADHEVALRHDRKRVRMLRLKLSSMGMESLLTDTHFSCKDFEGQSSRPCALSSITHVSSLYTCQIEANPVIILPVILQDVYFNV